MALKASCRSMRSWVFLSALQVAQLLADDAPRVALRGPHALALGAALSGSERVAELGVGVERCHEAAQILQPLFLRCRNREPRNPESGIGLRFLSRAVERHQLR